MTIIRFIPFLFLLNACTPKEVEHSSAVPESTDQVKLSEAQFKETGIITASPVEAEETPVLHISGTIDVPPQNMVSVSFPLGGYIRESHLLAGMHVRKNEVIAIIEDPQFIQLQQEYLTVKSKLDYLDKELNRQKRLHLEQAGSEKALQQAESDYQAQRVALKSLSEKLRLISVNPEKLTENTLSRSVNVLSPIDGFVSKVNVNIGKYVNPSDVVFELVNPDDIHLKMNVYEKDLEHIKIGQKVWAYSNTHPEKKHACEILLISKNLGNDRSAEVHCHFIKYDPQLLPGMYMNAEIPLESVQALQLPESAITGFDGKTYVFCQIQPYTYQLIEVKTGTTKNGKTTITEGLEKLANRQFVVSGAYALLMQLKSKDGE